MIPICPVVSFTYGEYNVPPSRSLPGFFPGPGQRGGAGVGAGSGEEAAAATRACE